MPRESLSVGPAFAAAKEQCGAGFSNGDPRRGCSIRGRSVVQTKLDATYGTWCDTNGDMIVTMARSSVGGLQDKRDVTPGTLKT